MAEHPAADYTGRGEVFPAPNQFDLSKFKFGLADGETSTGTLVRIIIIESGDTQIRLLFERDMAEHLRELLDTPYPDSPLA